MTTYSDLCEDYYMNVNLNTEMRLPGNRETILHFFEQVQKKYPSMENFYARENDEFVLEESKESGSYRWAAVEPRRILSGLVNPESTDLAMEQHREIFEMAPYFLSVRSLDCESLNFMFGFDFTYQGNHNKLVAEALGICGAMDSFANTIPGASVVDYEPAIQLALDENCRLQARLRVETRTDSFQVRSGEFGKEQISVYLMLRRYGSLEASETYTDALDEMHNRCRELLDGYVVDQVLVPLQQAIAID